MYYLKITVWETFSKPAPALKDVKSFTILNHSHFRMVTGYLLLCSPVL